jgi:hypothetical protein
MGQGGVKKVFCTPRPHLAKLQKLSLITPSNAWSKKKRKDATERQKIIIHCTIFEFEFL